jgi:hypothetical protein
MPLATPGIPQQEIVVAFLSTQERMSRCLDQATSIVPPSVVEQPSTPMTLKTSLADDASKYWDASLLDIEGLLTDLVDDIASAGS